MISNLSLHYAILNPNTVFISVQTCRQTLTLYYIHSNLGTHRQMRNSALSVGLRICLERLHTQYILGMLISIKRVIIFQSNAKLRRAVSPTTRGNFLIAVYCMSLILPSNIHSSILVWVLASYCSQYVAASINYVATSQEKFISQRACTLRRKHL